MPDDAPVVQVDQLAAEARRQLCVDCDQVLRAIRVFLYSLAPCVADGSISQDLAWKAVRTVILDTLDAQIPLKSHSDPILRQLVHEAYDAFTNRESVINIREWCREAEKLW